MSNNKSIFIVNRIFHVTKAFSDFWKVVRITQLEYKRMFTFMLKKENQINAFFISKNKER